jgi:esterase/lipase superfamily enzyme
MKYFKAYKADGLKIPTYFIESTAPDNVDDTAQEADSKTDKDLPTQLKLIASSDKAVEQIAHDLVKGADPNLVVMVHGFNNPEQAVVKTYTAAAIAVNKDGKISERDGLVCVGYRWPSESMKAPAGSSWSALPTLPRQIVYAGAAFILISLLLFHREWDHWAHFFILVGLILAGLILMAVLLRVIVYFRDNYRASNYGVPDLIQIIRAIDGAVVEQRRQKGLEPEPQPDNRIQLSFIGHSMGGFVVTNTIRTLTDVFKMPVKALSHYGADAPPPSSREKQKEMQEIGKVFELKRFVLASPDIPAEHLLSDRGNFLASALSRFEEAYLFSNEGDEVLRQISTLANYFVFPTKSRDHGFRLGNVEILSSNFGRIKPKAEDFLSTLRIGNLTLQQLYDRLEEDEARRRGVARTARTEPRLPKVFTYFDCTDYFDKDDKDNQRALLSFAKWQKRYDPKARLPFHSHLRLLLAYLSGKPNVHGGYFEGRLSQQLIYRLACLGYDGTVAAYDGEASPLDKACEEKQIRMLLAPYLAERRHDRAIPRSGRPIEVSPS